jgi:xanthine dehydrogenase accessory factor
VNEDAEILAQAARLAVAGEPFALISIVRTSGSTPRKAGAKMIVRASGELYGTVGGGRIEVELVAQARAAIEEGAPRLVRRHLTHEVGMCCGGEMEAFIEPLGRQPTLVLVGGGHISSALAPIASRVGFRLVVVDEMESFAEPERFPSGARFVHDWDPRQWGVAFGRDAYVVIATRDHAVDQEVLEELAAIEARPAYLGVIGSRGKMGRFRRRLEQKGVAEAWLGRVRGPIGVDVAAETPEEIAVAVAAELIGVRRRPQAS